MTLAPFALKIINAQFSRKHKVDKLQINHEDYTKEPD